ncbi:efflux RND transporter periplasmic adaptor subunit [Sphingomonas sp. SFZ2018-12]|uniref:efflux RND transporter periplasmic adaptor subunit n=1 Tax=Sphingomonas sp. SFZ2018-12 TaxID=2683197 RepID=UPI001F0DD46B|nr:efflux RND transporter periplasmic adaptor subunit [Sphingomonas sp. SFZ2018-12]MCH4894682.1 efflux RND transporter periplasmic adaptor subunit [Sphingomonas sp. SFZ2018-12]
MADQSSPDLDTFLGAKQRPRWRTRLYWALAAIGVLLLILAAMRLFSGPEAPRYSTQTVTRGNLEVSVSATGKLAPTNQVTVGSELSGLVTRVLVDVNDRVAKGQPLALIDPAQLDDQIRQTQAQLAANRAAVAQQRATLTEAQATLTRFEEVSRLSGGRVPAKTELDTARAAVGRAIANVRAAEANVQATSAQLSSNQTQRSRAVIRSPVNGVVLARQVDAGQTVAASFNTPTLFVIAEDLSAMKLEVAIDEADVGQVQQGQRATFTVDAFPGERFPAQITRVDVGSNLSAQEASAATTSTTTSANQVVSYAAVLSVDNPGQRLRPGMTATAEIVTSSAGNVLLVPNAALRFTPQAEGAGGQDAGSGVAGALIPRGRRFGRGAEKTAEIGRGSQQTVYVLGADRKPQQVKITTGNSNGQMTQVTGGDLRPGMKVIVGQLSGGEEARSGGGGGRRQGGGGPGGGGRRGQ